MLTRIMRIKQVLSIIEKRVALSSQRDVAREMSVSEAYLSDVRRGKRNPGPAIIRGLGLREQKIYSRLP
jgi:transcriptional regulator with XRE-family HTH domain